MADAAAVVALVFEAAVDFLLSLLVNTMKVMTTAMTTRVPTTLAITLVWRRRLARSWRATN